MILFTLIHVDTLGLLCYKGFAKLRIWNSTAISAISSEAESLLQGVRRIMKDHIRFLVAVGVSRPGSSGYLLTTRGALVDYGGKKTRVDTIVGVG